MTRAKCFKAIARDPAAAAGGWARAGSVRLKAEVDRLEKLTGKAAKPGKRRRRQETHGRRMAGRRAEETG